jgi:hypothetical protein
MQIFQQQKLDFSSAKSVFTSGIYKMVSLSEEDEMQVLKAFFSLLT